MTYGKEILNIREVQGRKSPNDRKILVENKPLSIRDLLKLIRLMAENELRINGDVIARNNNFLFRKAVLMAIDNRDISIDNIMKITLTPNWHEDMIIYKGGKQW